MALDRAVTLRSDLASGASRLEDPESSAVASSAEGVLVEPSGERLARRPLTPEVLAAGEPILLGLDRGRAVFAVDLDALGAPAAERFARGATIIGLREAGALLTTGGIQVSSKAGQVHVLAASLLPQWTSDSGMFAGDSNKRERFDKRRRRPCRGRRIAGAEQQSRSRAPLARSASPGQAASLPPLEQWRCR
jgi:hypothetical protein